LSTTFDYIPVPTNEVSHDISGRPAIQLLEETLLVEGSNAPRKGLNAAVKPDDLILDCHDPNRSEIPFMMPTSGSSGQLAQAAGFDGMCRVSPLLPLSRRRRELLATS
jgi:hypothetical protein